jgi:hypothetical protein
MRSGAGGALIRQSCRRFRQERGENGPLGEAWRLEHCRWPRALDSWGGGISSATICSSASRLEPRNRPCLSISATVGISVMNSSRAKSPSQSMRICTLGCAVSDVEAVRMTLPHSSSFPHKTRNTACVSGFLMVFRMRSNSRTRGGTNTRRAGCPRSSAGVNRRFEP